ncbi:SAV_2336 N-terminal domain-related protein [Kitasatospora sp. NPDC059827]|uniref:SAV_2336 N-terminal domain-related protein n=1 Tax=Kitasatospora sp. NPDC059827 TaxID=3346964 RepID=UPI00365B0AEA
MDGFGTGGVGTGCHSADGEPAAHAVLRQALAALAAPEDGASQPQDLADVLWISRLAGLGPLPATDPDTDTATDPESPGGHPAPPATLHPNPHQPTADPRQDPRRPADTAPARPRPPAPTTPQPGPKVELHPRHAPADPGHPDGPVRGAEVVQVTRPPALPGALAIARALRPLRRPLTQRPGGRRPSHLDEEATAEATAEAGVLLPVWQRTEPRYSVDLLVDTGATMAVWHDLAGELATLLERHGAFEEVRTWSLDTDRGTPHLTPFRRRRTAAPPPAAPDPNWSRPLADPHGRRILFVLTDGVGPAWYGRELVPFLARAAAAGPAAALQVLPRRLWHRTALRPAPVEARAATHGRPVPRLRTESTLPGIPRGRAGASARASVGWLPVLEIDADWIAPWADLTAGRTTGWTPMLAAPLSGIPRPPRPRTRDTAARPPADRVAAFRAGSSPNAHRLACHLAAAPLSLPVMRLVQRSTVPESGQRELAELFLSGLIEVREKAADPDEVVYDFVDGVREELLGELTRTESVRVLEHVLAKVSGRVAATFGGTLDFRALAAAMEDSRHRLPERSRPFAEVAARVLAGAGGQHVTIARHLSSAVGDRTFRRELLTPPPPLTSPPDPPRMIGRQEELDRLVQACERGGTRTRLIAIEAAQGMGRRRLLQEYVRLHGGQHPFIHWIDGRTADTMAAGFERLRAALGAESADRLDERLDAHPNWLVIVDDLWSDDLYPRELARLLDSEGGRVIVTTNSREGKPFLQSATTFVLAFLTEDELREEIRHRLGDAYRRIEYAQEFQHLLDRMPRRPDELATWHLDEKLAVLVGPPGPGDSYSTVRSFRLPSPALAIATVPNAYGLGRGYVAVYGADSLLRYLDVTTGQVVEPALSLGTTAADVVAMTEVSDRPALLCTAAPDGGFSFWDARDGSLVSGRAGRPEPPVAMSPYVHGNGSQYYWTSDSDGRMFLWRSLGSDDGDVPLELPGLPGGHRAWALTTLPGRGGRSLLVGVDPTGRLHRWQPEDPTTAEFFAAAVVDPARARTIVGISGDDTHCVLASIGDRDTHIHIWEFEGRWRADRRREERRAGDRAREAERPLVAERFRLVERIAQGRRSEVWRARDERDGSTVAVKSFAREHLFPELDQGLFQQQAGMLAGLDHPGLVAFRGSGSDTERLYLAVEFIDGPDLRSMLDGGSVPSHEAAVIAHGVAEALVYLHSHGIAHGRIEPANILIRPDGSPVLCDLGIDLDGNGTTDRTVDLFDLGTVLQETGVPEALHGLVLDLVHPDPRRRPSSAAEVLQRIAASGALVRPDRTTAPPLRFTLLGEVRAWRGDETVELGPGERKALLAALLKYRRRPVRAEVLIAEVRHRHTSSNRDIDEVRSHITELGRVLNSPSDPRRVLEELADHHTWVLNVVSEQIDTVLFEQALERALTARADADPAEARRYAEKALALWQGPPLADAPGPLAEIERIRLTGLYERAQELLLETAPSADPGDTRLGYRLLGPLRVLRGGESWPVGSPEQQAVLAALLLHAPAPVPTAGLVDALYGDAPPPQAVAAVRTYVSRLRSVLGDPAQPRGVADILQTVGDGYRLHVEPGSLDVAVFEQRLAEARQTQEAGDVSGAHLLLRSALDLWDGPALDGVPGPYASGERVRLIERRMAATEALYATGLALGRHSELANALERLVHENPLRERLSALLMLAHYRCGRRTVALVAYRQLQRALQQDSGLDTSPVVKRLYRMMQADDPDLRTPGSAEALIGLSVGTAVSADRTPGGESPQGVVIGRRDDARRSPVVVDFEADPLFAVFGDTGSGKTALLRLLVRRLVERYTSEQVGFLVVDFEGSLGDEVPPEYLVHHAGDMAGLATLVRILSVAATSRTPGSRGHKDIFLVVDDLDLVAANGDDPLSDLVRFLRHSRELGLRVIVADHGVGAGRARTAEPFLRAVCDLGRHGVLLSGDEQEGSLLGYTAAEPLPPGRGILVTPRRSSGALFQLEWVRPSGSDGAG